MILLKEEQRHHQIKVHIEHKEAGETIRQFLKRQWQVSGRLLTRLKKEASVLLNGEWAPFHTRLNEGDCLVLEMEEEPCEFSPNPINFGVVYEDEDLLVVNKPPGLLTHPTTRERTDTLANAVTHYMMQRNETYKVRFVNRLDMDTSGVMILAKNAFSHHHLMLQMQQDFMIKTYRVFVWGKMVHDEGTIDAPIYRPENIPAEEPPRRVVDPRGKSAISHYLVEQRYKEASLVKVTIETGRTHQIRVHMKHLGHPVIGDTFYEPSQPVLIDRQALHAAETEFRQPRFGTVLQHEAEFPDDMKQLEKLLGAGLNEIK
ncbi:RluA family pseudouridine synthase [Anoxynatronum buryatiense]|nr:RluA family pseudouridine synthase [Anoxynatronum buryatiense]